jgi:glutamate N-acetyltransferase/amino-acid N-acetyltransferase
VLPVTRFAALPAFARQAEQSVTFPLGFRAAGVAAGIKRSNRLDVGLLVSDTPCAAATFFTRNEAAAAPVVVTRDSSACDRLRGVVVNSGNANACTGAPGLSDALRMRDLAAASLGLPTAEVGVCSTGVIGEPLPMQRVEQGVRMAAAKLSTGGGGPRPPRPGGAPPPPPPPPPPPTPAPSTALSRWPSPRVKSGWASPPREPA